MNDRPVTFSIVTASYNAAATIADTLRSVRAQDYPNYQHIIVDGASKDATVEVVNKYRHDRLSLISEPDQGCYDAMNKGLRLATGDVVVFLNSDDFLARPDALSLVASAFSSTGADCVVGSTAIVDFENIQRVHRLYRGIGFRPWMLRFGHMPPHPSFYATREKLLSVGGFDTSFRVSADFDQMVRLFIKEQVRLATIPQTLSGFRIGGISTRDWAARMTIDCEIGRSLRQNGLASPAALRRLRYPLKALQLLRRPKDYPHFLEGVGLSGGNISSQPRNKEYVS